MKVSNKLFVKTVLVASLVLGSGASHAIDVVTNVGSLQTYANDTYIGFVNHIAPSEPTGTVFSDYFNFSTNGTGGSSVATTLTLSNVLDITGLSVSLYNGTGSANVGSLVAGPVGSGITINAVLTASAPYTLKISGTTSGSIGGSYSTAISAVPEAKTYAMMLAGLAFVGFMARRNARLSV